MALGGNVVAIKLQQSLKQTQTLMMTPQLQQAIKLLTLTHLEMTNVISQEMVENPLLEEVGDSTDGEERISEEQTQLEERNVEATADSFTESSIIEGGKEEIDWNSYIENFNNNSSSPPSMVSTDPDEAPNYENIVSKGTTLPEHLEWQLRMESLTESDWSIARQIIHNINEDGYLEVSVDEIVESTGRGPDEVMGVLELIQNMDPVGCGARNLAECLMIQAKLLDPRSPLLELLISKHLEELKKKDYAGISKSTGIDRDKIKHAEILMHMFDPKPGRMISAEETQYVVPDIYVRQMGNEFVIELNDEGVPRLKISNLYRSMIKQNNKATKEFVEDKLRGAMWLIKSIQNRQRTIVKVAQAILKYQPEFFRKGAEYLRPMILKDIAAEIGMHESTVSRVTTNKYMHTPLGIFELKYFFNSGVGGKDGGIDVASESLKLKIKAMILAENPKRPLSDQKIAELLEREGINVARRTVAKYREMMHIGSSSERKKKD